MRVAEKERARQAAKGEKVAQRADLKAQKRMEEAGLMINQTKTAGHMPGHEPGKRCASQPDGICTPRSAFQPWYPHSTLFPSIIVACH